MEKLGAVVNQSLVCLNPYCNGRYSWRAFLQVGASYKLNVLILIVMEDTHGELVIALFLGISMS